MEIGWSPKCLRVRFLNLPSLLLIVIFKSDVFSQGSTASLLHLIHQFQITNPRTMAITVGPTYNDATGEYGEQQVSYTMHHGSNVPVALEEAGRGVCTLEPDKYSNDAAFGDNPTEAELNAFWASDRPITPDEISIIQDHIQKLGFDSDEGRRLGRFLNYRVTGNSDELYDDDKLALKHRTTGSKRLDNEEAEQFIL